jgi:hypothetical protein
MTKQPKMNKFVTAAIGAAVVVSAVAPAAGAAWTNTPDWMQDSLQDLVKYGVIDADSTLSATGEVTRGEVALYFARALKLDLENVENPGFADVPTSHKYYNAIAALAAADKMNGTKIGFEPDRVINRAEMASLIVKAFGYEYGNGANLVFTDLKGSEWAKNAIAALVDANIVSGVNKAQTLFAPTATLTRQDTVGFLWKALRAADVNFNEVTEVVNPSDLTMNQGSAFDLPETVAVKYHNDVEGAATVEWNTKDIDVNVPGTYTIKGDVEGTDLTAVIKVEVKAIDAAVVNVEATDLKTIVVEFNQPMDDETATDKANYLLNGGTLAAEDAIELSDDKKSAIITLDTALTNESYITLSVSEGDEILSATDKEVENIVKSIYVNDKVKPEISSTDYVAVDNEVIITFTEEIAAGTIVVKDEDGVTVLSDSKAFDGKEMTLDTSSLEEDVTYTFEMVGAKDLAGNYFMNNKAAFTFTVGTDDEVKPEVEQVKIVANNKIEVTFSEKLSDAGSIKVNAAGAQELVEDKNLNGAYDYKVDASGLVYTIVVPTMSNDTFNKFEFSNQVDLAGNALKTITKTLSYVDNANPSVVQTTTDYKEVTIEFDENIEIDGAISAKLYAPNGVVQTISTNKFSVEEDNNVVVDLSSAVSEILSGSYKLVFEEDMITDVDGNSEAYTVNFTLSDSSDTTKPVVADNNIVYSSTEDTVTVTFSEEMGQSAIDVDNYTVDGENVFENAYFDGATNVVVLDLKNDVFGFTADRVFEINNVKDKAGNTADEITKEINFVENTAPELLTVELAADGTTVTLTFNEAVKNVTNDDFEVEVGGSVEGTTATKNDSAREIVLTFDTALTPTEAAKTITVKATDDLDVADLNNNEFSFISKVASKK